MSMTATFVQVDAEELARIEADPSLAERLFQDGPVIPPQFMQMSKLLEERMRKAGPQMMARALEQLDPRIKQQLEQRIGRTAASLATGQGGEDLLRLMEERRAKIEALGKSKPHASISLEKEWHGVHYVLCGEVEPGESLLSKAVLGGNVLGEDDEGFSGYGPARSFTSGQVAELSAALSNPEVEREAAARFDAARMSKLGIYPGWRASDAEQVMQALRQLRDFYADAASKGRGIVTCLV